MDRFLTVKEIAHLLGIAPRTVTQYRYKGRLKLPMEKRNGMLRCRESEFNKWMEG